MVNLGLYLILGIIWGSSYSLMKIMSPVVGPLWTIEIRVLLGAIVLSIISLFSPMPKIKFSQHWDKLLLIAALKLTIPFFLIAYSAQFLPASLIAVFFSTGPLWSTLINLFFKTQKISYMTILGLIIGFFGVFVLAGFNTNASGNNIFYSILVLLAAIMYASGGIYAKKVNSSMQLTNNAILLVSLWIATTLGGGLVLLTDQTVPTWTDLQSILYPAIALGLFCTGIANIIYFRLLNTWGTITAISVVFLIPLYSMVWSSYLLDELITKKMLFGCLLILLGSVLVIYQQFIMKE